MRAIGVYWGHGAGSIACFSNFGARQGLQVHHRMLQQRCSVNKKGLHFPPRSMGHEHWMLHSFRMRSRLGCIHDTSFCNPTFLFWTGIRTSRISSKGAFSSFTPLDRCSSVLTSMSHRIVSQSHALSHVCSWFRTFLAGSNPTWTPWLGFCFRPFLFQVEFQLSIHRLRPCSTPSPVCCAACFVGTAEHWSHRPAWSAL